MQTLEEKYNLIEQSSMEELLSSPTAFNLSKIPKKLQTLELLYKVCKNDGCALQYASKKLINSELCEIAVNQNGEALKYIPNKIFENNKTYSSDDSWAIKIYKSAAKTYGEALKYIPEQFINKEMVINAIKAGESIKNYSWSIYPITYVPSKYITHDVCVLSVSCSPFSIKNINDERKDYYELAQIAVSKNGDVIQYVKEEYINKELVRAALNNNPLAIQYIPNEFIDKILCEKCFQENYKSFVFFPVSFITEEMCLQLINEGHFSVLRNHTYKKRHDSQDFITFLQFPVKLQNNLSIINRIIEINKENARLLIEWNETIKNRINVNSIDRPITNRRGEIIIPLNKNVIDYLSKIVLKNDDTDNEKYSFTVLEEYNKEPKSNYLKIPESYYIIPSEHQEIIVHDLSEYECASEKIYYISDIHIEHQAKVIKNLLKKEKLTFKIKNILIDFLDNKISEMIEKIEINKEILLVGGDVADSSELSRLFYERLCRKWKGRVIAILGNHELWDRNSTNKFTRPNPITRTVDEIFSDFRDIEVDINNDRMHSCTFNILENEVFIQYKNNQVRIISEEDILGYPENDLNKLFSKCSQIILGGLGYSGLNDVYNASMGLYNNTINIDEDKRRAEAFKQIHDKISRCASEKKVIVLTHTPVYDWMPEGNCIPGWIYINGHTHINSICRHDNGSVILADNQVGYTPGKWKLNSIMVDYWYDPFEKYEDGIYRIDSDQYKEFYNGRGVTCNGCNYPGILYLLKKNGLYMFILKYYTGLCLMLGGQRKRLEKDDINYYYNNMDEYGNRIKELIRPYQNAMENLSKEVKKIGGTGTIHGCIVDISYFSHLYLNPYDGKVTPYWALDISGRRVYPDIKKLLTTHESDLYERYLLAEKNHSIPLLEGSSKKQITLSTVPKWVLGTDIYNDSRIMKSIQYAWQQNVIRIWNDDVFEKTSKSTNRIEKEEVYEASEQKSLISLSTDIITVSKEDKNEVIPKISVRSTSSNKYIGQSKVMKNGKAATIIEFFSRWNITVKFDDEHIVKNRTIWDFKNGNIE